VRLRFGLILLAVGGLGAAAVLFTSGADSCPSGGVGKSPIAAIHDYYRSCSPRPEISAYGDGDKESTAYARWHATREFVVVYSDHRTRFVLVGQKTPTSAWRVLDGEGTGP
jgi:hypothetical protein